jgi:hypothetical protein
MSLPASQRRALNQIEETLANDHPGLGPMFAIFTRLTGHEAMPLTEQVTARPWLWPRRWPQRLRPAVVTLIGLAMATGALLTLSLLLPGPQACAPGTVSPVAAQTQPVPIGRPRTCPTQQDKTSETSGSGLYTP